MTRAVAALAVGLWLAATGHAQDPPARLGLGAPAPREAVAAIDIDVRPDGTGLPPGRGSMATGAAVYAGRCAVCHGAEGEGGIADALVGALPDGTPPFGPAYEQWRGDRPDVPFTVGNYWPYATTLFDYIRRAMPADAPGSLTADEVYGLTAWILAKNGIVAGDAVLDAGTLPAVVMPARDRFVPDDRAGGARVR